MPFPATAWSVGHPFAYPAGGACFGAAKRLDPGSKLQ
jgi:hypothetical protein